MFKSRLSFSPVIWIIGFLLCAFVSLYVRAYPWRVGLNTSVYEKASVYTTFAIKEKIAQQIKLRNAELDDAAINNKALEQLNQLMHDHPNDIIKQIDQLSSRLYHEQANKEQLFLLESDPYYYYQLSQNIAKTGQISSQIKGSKYLNPLMNAPEGSWQPFTLHPYFGFYLHHIIKTFWPNITLMDAASTLPLVITFLTILVFFIACGSLGLSAWATVGSAFPFFLAPIYLKRSAYGWYDTDPYNVLFTLILTVLIVHALRQQTRIRAIIFGIIFGIFLCLYALIWQGWVMMFFISTGCALALIGYCLITQRLKNTIKPTLFFLLSSTLSAAVFISLAFGIKDFFILFAEGLGELIKFTNKGLDIWPNLFIGVGELKKTTPLEFAANLGGLWYVCLTFAAGAWAFQKYIIQYHYERTLDTVLIGALALACLWLSFGAERFVLFSLIPLSLLFAFALDTLPWMVYSRPSLSLLLIILTSYFSINGISRIVTPIFNPVWNNALTSLKIQTPPQTVVNTWWSPGHFIKAIAERPVLFDGATLGEGAMGYWLSKALLTDNEKKAQGILSMINSHRLEAVNFAVRQGLSFSQASRLLEDTAALSKEAASKRLLEDLKPQARDEMMALLYPTVPPSSALLLYNELIDECIILALSGQWDIAKIEEINANPNALKNIPKRSSKAFIDFYWSIANGQPRISPVLKAQMASKDTIVFDNGVYLNPLTKQIIIKSPEYGTGIPVSVIYADQNGIQEKINPNPTLSYSAVFFIQEGQPNIRLMDSFLARSLLIKLFYFNGVGLKYFKALGQFTDQTQRTSIKTFTVLNNQNN